MLVEQNIDMIRAMAQRCYVMDKGRIVAELTPAMLDDTTSSADISPSITGEDLSVVVRTIHHGPNGVAKGKPGAKHAITEAVQGKYHYTYGPFAKPVADRRSRRRCLVRDA